jgi:hypothetical protein
VLVENADRLGDEVEEPVEPRHRRLDQHQPRPRQTRVPVGLAEGKAGNDPRLDRERAISKREALMMRIEAELLGWRALIGDADEALAAKLEIEASIFERPGGGHLLDRQREEAGIIL